MGSALIKRNSSFELLRIIAQFMIIFYHLIWAFTEKYQEIYPIYKAIQMPIHVGVLLFILLSGYFGIRPKFAGIVKILIRAFVYYTPFAIIISIHETGGVKLDDFLFLSHTPFWFIRTYLLLCLVAPAINVFLDNSSAKIRLTFLFLLAFFSCYIGAQQTDVSLSDGKNIINFLLLYVIGHELKCRYEIIEKLKTWNICVLYITFVIFQLSIWLYADDNIKDFIMLLSYPYCGLFLIIEAILLFMLFMKIKIHSRFINKISSAVLGIYMLHVTPLVFYRIIGRGANYILSVTNAEVLPTMSLFAVYTFCIFSFCYVIDRLLQKIIDKLSFNNN